MSETPEVPSMPSGQSSLEIGSVRGQIPKMENPPPPPLPLQLTEE